MLSFRGWPEWAAGAARGGDGVRVRGRPGDVVDARRSELRPVNTSRPRDASPCLRCVNGCVL